jgi:hypothetical protein
VISHVKVYYASYNAAVDMFKGVAGRQMSAEDETDRADALDLIAAVTLTPAPENTPPSGRRTTPRRRGNVTPAVPPADPPSPRQQRLNPPATDEIDAIDIIRKHFPVILTLVSIGYEAAMIYTYLRCLHDI